VAAAVTRSLFSPAYRRLRDWLVAGRQAQSLTQVQLAEKLGRPQSFVSKYERGERRLDFVEVYEIAEVLRIDICDLVTEIRRSRS
jgi:transcriptional regulator with XRE-family HTH domain